MSSPKSGAYALFLPVLLVVAGTASIAQEPPTRDSCERERAASPSEFDSYRCFDALTRVPGGRAGAVESLEEVVLAEPGNIHARLFLARVLSPRGPRPLELFESAIRKTACDRLTGVASACSGKANRKSRFDRNDPVSS
jgi:hypothetical protein